MNLYDKASLIITPNAYKAGKIYAAKPTSGGGDLTFDRNSVTYRNNASGVLEQVAINTPRLNYNTIGGCPALLIEPARTNLFLNSFAPVTQTITVVNGTVYTVSINGGTATLSGAGTGSATTGTNRTFTASGTSLTVTISGSPIWCQVEAGSFATSPILTAASSVTRVGDAVFNSNATSFIGQGSGTVFVSYIPHTFGVSTGRIFVSTDIALTDRIWLAYNTNNTITCFIRNTSGMIYAANSTALQVNGLNKIAIAYANGDIRIYLNGTLVLSSSASMVFVQPRNNLFIGSSENSNDLNQIYIGSCYAYLTALTNSECINLTT